ncbi:MAG TPA: inorganic diphosphatase [Vicinamibacterales bacterium]|nr:inorganic diphosphatase [Vicinamibacterales bacterium]
MKIVLPLGFILGAAVGAQMPERAPNVLPAAATTELVQSLAAVAPHAKTVWRDMSALNDNGSVNGFVEIPRGERRKFEFDMKANALRIDRVMPESLGGYPVNYGWVPQTISYDGDPFDVLVLGPEIAGGSVVQGVIVGLMFMEDETGHDSKVVISAAGPDGRPVHPLTAADQARIGDYFSRYKAHEPGKFSRVPGWGSAAQGLSYVKTTHAFFVGCRQQGGKPCEVTAR